jgi:hypothetical protein
LLLLLWPLAVKKKKPLPPLLPPLPLLLQPHLLLTLRHLLLLPLLTLPLPSNWSCFR